LVPQQIVTIPELGYDLPNFFEVEEEATVDGLLLQHRGSLA